MRAFVAFLVLSCLTAFAKDNSQFLYIANGTNRGGKGGTITAYKIDGPSGKLTPVIGSPFDSGLIPYSLATDNGSHLYLANPELDDNNLRVFPIRPSTGRLETEHASTFETANYEGERNCCPGPILADKTGHFVYVGNTDARTVSVYEVTPGTLALTQVSKVNTSPGHFPVALVWGPRQETLFAFTDPGLAVSQLHIYRRDAKNGSLTEAPGSPRQIPNLIQVAATDKQLFALTTAPRSSQLLIYDINSDGTISGEGFPVQISQKPSAFAIDPKGENLVLATNQGKATNLFLYTLADTPAFSRSTKLACAKSCSITSMSFDSTGKYVYVADTANETVTGLDAASLTELPGSPWKSSFQPHSLLVVASR